LIVSDKINVSEIEKLFKKDHSLDCFSLRLGKNIIDKPLPNFNNYNNNIITWATSKNIGKIWNYFWELSSSIYRKEFVLDYIKKCRKDKEYYPNPLESHYYSCMPSFVTGPLRQLFIFENYCFKNKSNKMASFNKSRCFTIGVNKTADDKIHSKQLHNPVDLHEKMLEGYIIDFKSLIGEQVQWPNAGSKFFKLIKD